MLHILLGVIIIVSSIFSAPYINNYYQSQKLTKEAQMLYSQNKNDEALDKYEEAQKFWGSEKNSLKILELREGIENDKYFELGTDSIDSEDWYSAIVYLTRVTGRSKNYSSAQTLLNYAKEKLKNADGKVKGVSTVKTIDNIKIELTNTPTPTNFPTPTIYIQNVIVPTQTPAQNYEAICSSRQEQWEGTIKAGWNDILIDLNNKLQTADPLLYNYMLSKVAEYKMKVSNCIMTCGPIYFQHCLNNQGNDSGFNMYSSCTSCNITN